MRQQNYQNYYEYIASFVLFTLQLFICESETSDVCMTTICVNESQSILSKLDDKVDPCDNFYHFACGSFVNQTVIPDDKTSIDITTVLDDNLKKQLNKILNSSVSEDDIDPFIASKKLYKACLNENLIEEYGLTPMKRIIDSLGGWPIVEGKNWADNVWYWQKILAKLDNLGFDSSFIFSASIDVDMKNSSKKVIYIDQPSLAFDREYFLKGLNDEIIHSYYKLHVDTVVLFGAERFVAELEAKNVLNFEIDLAKILIPKEERRNLSLMHNPTTIDKFQSMFPIHDWYKYLHDALPKEIKLTEDEELIITDFDGILNDVYKLLIKTPNRIIVNYLIWRTTFAVTEVLNKKLRERYLDFVKTLTGMQSYEERWRECVDVVIGNLPVATSTLYIKNYFKQESKAMAKEMVDSIKNEFEKNLQSISWMDDTTREAALQKAKKMIAHIGYPDELTNYEKVIEYYKGLEVNENMYLESILNISRFDTEKALKSFRKPFNKTDWQSHANVAVINAFYSPQENSIQFPAGILQGQFFSANRPKYLNYGAIGFVIGHEITHGFDDEGSQFDSDGNLVDWWKMETKEAYLEKARCIIDQYDNYTEPNVGLNLNGINTQGENIADNGGIKQAYLAYKSYVEKNGEEPKLPNLNYNTRQLFWISAAQTWCSVTRSEKIKLEITSDTHSPEMFRVNGPFSNMQEFIEDFQCAADSTMNRETKCEVW